MALRLLGAGMSHGGHFQGRIPGLSIGRGFRLQWEAAQNAYVLLFPEGMIKLNGSAGEIMKAMHGRNRALPRSRPISSARSGPPAVGGCHPPFMEMAYRQQWLSGSPMTAVSVPPTSPVNSARAAALLLPQLTYRCPAATALFATNPTDFARSGPELGTEDWLARAHGGSALRSVQLGLVGREPLSRETDLEPIVAEAHRAWGSTTNLITSGVGPQRDAGIRALKDAGLDHIQLSFQDSTRQNETTS